MDGPLGAARATLAKSIALAVDMMPALERSFVRAGRAASRRSRLARGLYRVSVDALVPRLRRTGRRYRHVRIHNVGLFLDVTDATGRYPYFHGDAYESAVTDAIVTALRPGDVFVDIGANIGYFSLLAARLVGQEGRVVAFEPHEGARAALRRLADRNDVEGTIEIVPTALAEREANMTLFTADGFSAYSTLDPQLSPMREIAAFRPAIVVATVTLDGWLSTRPDLAKRIRCIKIDVEGAESRVVSGMARTLSARDLTVICETTIGSGADLALERAGFRRRRIESGKLPYSNWLYVRAHAR